MQSKITDVQIGCASRIRPHGLGSADGLDEWRIVLTIWADFLSHCEQGREWRPGNVAPIRAAL